jgi:predicted PurR-regulated permease PerM
MTAHYELFKQQRVLWACALFVGVVLIFYANAPVIPVIAGCILVPALTALRSWFRSRK